jgi:hypothetical protein
MALQVNLEVKAITAGFILHTAGGQDLVALCHCRVSSETHALAILFEDSQSSFKKVHDGSL